jgi:xylulose-5-phosphate/fructose-6-phosphate phosphoketolase
MLSEQTMEGMLEGYLLACRHGFISSYEAFVHVIDSLFNRHAKWLSTCNDLCWREGISSLNLLITSTVWRQDHTGFTHQDPGFLDIVVNKSASGHAHLPATRRQLPSIRSRSLSEERKLCQRNHL